MLLFCGIPFKFTVTPNFLLRVTLRIVYHEQYHFTEKESESRADLAKGTGLEQYLGVEPREHEH